jgi:hypothetical protein
VVGDLVDVLGHQLQVAAQHLDPGVRHAAHDLEPDGVAPAAAAHLVLDQLQQVAASSSAISMSASRVTGRRAPAGRVAGEEVGDPLPDHVLEHHERVPAPGSRRKRGSTDGTCTIAVIVVPVVLVDHLEQEREREVGQPRERVPGIDRQRREDGEELVSQKRSTAARSAASRSATRG